MEKIVVFNDYANTNCAFDKAGGSPDYGQLLDYVSEGRFLVEAHTYVPIDPLNPHGRDHVIDDQWGAGWLVHTKVGARAGDTYKCDFDVEITLDLMRTAEIVKPDIIVLLSGDKDFIPVMLELRRRGIRVEVAGFPGINAAREVMLKASGFIDLRTYLVEREAAAERTNAALGGEDWPEIGIDNEIADPEPMALGGLSASYRELPSAT